MFISVAGSISISAIEVLILLLPAIIIDITYD